MVSKDDNNEKNLIEVVGNWTENSNWILYEYKFIVFSLH
jgi:hypothetical protein